MRLAGHMYRATPLHLTSPESSCTYGQSRGVISCSCAYAVGELSASTPRAGCTAAMDKPAPLAAAPDRVLHGQGGVSGPYRVARMGNRSAEQRYDAITRHPCDGLCYSHQRMVHASQGKNPQTFTLYVT